MLHRITVNIALLALAFLSLAGFAKEADPLRSKPELGLHVTPAPQVELVDDVVGPAPIDAVQPGPAVGGIDQSSIASLALTGVSKLAELGKAKQWGPFTSVLLFLLVSILRLVARATWFPLGKVKDALLSRWGGWGLNFGVSLAGGFAVQALAGPFTFENVFGIIVGAVTSSLAVAGGLTLFSDTKGRNDAAAQAGTDAAGAVTTKKQALDVITGKQ